MWWRKKNVSKPEMVQERKPRQLTLDSNDSNVVRATKILQASGMVVNDFTYSTIVPWMAIAIQTYRELDREEWEREQKSD